ncbi:multi-sensor signal transduction histidine kinase [Desulfovibrio sp. X2]|uniref:ATP-binding protein n=1 Tax=Desulfovibrio sp. X2 TaxID=941449 RepID=UPI00035886CF|nr:ATP-binding protein [Desulfovibrio sp. X2]EPR37312.1 multi-sensor signal transduction histidine kinase [Desulfovibrio sp. X2]
MRSVSALSLSRKIFFTTLAFILLVSGIIALLARGILVSSLTTELLHRGTAIAQSLAERARSQILDNDTAGLVSLVFDSAYLGERRDLVSYIFITDQDGRVLAHTFTRPFPDDLSGAAPAPGETHAVREITVLGQPVYDISVPITEGIYTIGSTHVGLNKRHIDNLVGKLRITFLGFISLVIVVLFFISLRIANYITMPITKLTRISDELSRGNFDISVNLDGVGGDWSPQDCPAYLDTDLPCWHFDQTRESEEAAGEDGSNLRTCRLCRFYTKASGDEVQQLASSFRNMVWSIKLYRRRLRESEEKYRSLFVSGPDPIVVVDAESYAILDANPRAEEVYGYTRAELAGVPYTALDPDFSSQCLARFELPGGRESGCVYCTKLIHYRKDGLPIYVNLHACPISYKNRQAYIIASADVTEMIEKDAQLIQASKMKTLGEMSAGIAHELNQPLNAIRMGSDFLGLLAGEAQALSPAQIKPISDEISQQVDRATDIINTLRAFGRKADMIREELCLNDSVRGVLKIVGHQLSLAGIETSFDLADDLPPVMAHDNRIQQVLFNLVTNARDAIIKSGQPPKDGHRILLRTFARDAEVVVQIADTGVGIPESVREKIFEPFFTTKETGQGMGLGLSISYGIVKDYDGEIRIDSSPGRGSVFELVFPRAAARGKTRT